MAGEQRYFGRQYRLLLEPPEGKSRLFEVEEGKPAMDIKFDVSYARGQTAREGTVSILGLSLDTMHEFLKLAGMTRGKAMSQLVHVRLDAGYFSSAGLASIIDGYCWHATVSSPPQMWLTMKISEVNPLGHRQVTLSDNGPLPIRAAVESILDAYSNEQGEGVTLELEDMTEDGLVDSCKEKIRISESKGMSLSDAIRKLNDNCAGFGLTFIMKTSKDDAHVRTLIAVDKDPFKATVGEVQVDNEHGLLSVTGIDAINACITTFIDGTVTDNLAHMNLTSRLNPQADGRYYIVKKQFTGHYLGQEWYARYFCSAREGDNELEAENKAIPAA